MKKILFLFLLLVSFTSCKKFLTELPQNNYSDQTVFKTDQDISYALNALYAQIGGLNDNPVAGAGLEYRSEFSYSQYTDDAFSRLGHSNLAFTPSDIDITNDYAWRYDAIRDCNEFILLAPGATLDPAKLKRYLAEARFIRAWHYDRLNFLFGDVPLLTAPTPANFFPKKAKRKKVFDFVTQELTEIASDLPLSYTSADIGRITSGAALALKARHLLNAVDWYGDKAYLYSEARKAAEAVITSNAYLLETGAAGFKKIFTFAEENGGSKDVILNSNYDLSSRTHAYARCILPKGAYSGSIPNNSNYIGITNNLVEAFQTLNGQDIHSGTSGYNQAKPWDNRDPRLDITVLRAGESIPKKGGNGTATYTYDAHPSIKPADGVTTDDVTQSAVNTTGYGFQKYQHFTFNAADQDFIDYVMLRYSEVLLMYAEAVLEENGNIALAMSYVDKVRTRVGMPTVATSYGAVSSVDQGLSIILQERRFEFATEGPQRFFDIRRYHLGEAILTDPIVYGIPLGPNRLPTASVLEGSLDNSVKIIAGTHIFSASTYYLWPLPIDATTANPNLSLPAE